MRDTVIDVAELSVVIPTRNRPALLGDCLQTLVEQQTTTRVEVIVVDDGSTRPVEPLVSRFKTESITFHTLAISNQGLNMARNHGVKASSAQVIAFLDDDTLVAPGWCEGILKGFQSLGCAGLAGRILLQYDGPRPSWLWIEEHGYLSGLDLGETPMLLDDGRVPVGANCAVRRAWFNSVAGFRVGLDRADGSLLSGGDTDFFRRIVTAGGTLGYAPTACVRHRVPPQRLTLRYFVKRGVSQGLTDALVGGKPTTFPEVARWWLVTTQHVARAPFVLVKNLLLGRGLLAPMTWSARCVGRLSALVYWSRRS